MSNIYLADIPDIDNPAVTGLKGQAATNATSIFGKFFSSLVGIILAIATIWTLFQLLQGGLEWISSGGDKNGVDNARNRMTNAVIGLLILFASWMLYMVILQFLGIIPSGGGFQIKLPTLF